MTRRDDDDKNPIRDAIVFASVIFVIYVLVTLMIAAIKGVLT